MLLFRRIRFFSTSSTSTNRGFSSVIKTHGLYFGLYYWISNEALVVLLTYFLYYDYFGKDIVCALVERFSPSFYKIDFSNTDKKWSFFGGKFSVDPKLAADFIFSSVTMSLLTPVQIPFCAATYPWLRRKWPFGFQKVLSK